LSVLKQCAQVATIFVAPDCSSTSTFCIASWLKRNSLPERRAGSPVHDSPPGGAAGSVRCDIAGMP